jgi:hypothetical protein
MKTFPTNSSRQTHNRCELPTTRPVESLTSKSKFIHLLHRLRLLDPGSWNFKITCENQCLGQGHHFGLELLVFVKLEGGGVVINVTEPLAALFRSYCSLSFLLCAIIPSQWNTSFQLCQRQQPSDSV